MKRLPPPIPPPDWYPDPEESDVLRFWDGSDWTDRRKPDPQAEASPQPSVDSGGGLPSRAALLFGYLPGLLPDAGRTGDSPAQS